MEKAIGMLEYKTVSKGMYVADQILKLASINLLQASVVCPGKYIVLFQGELSSIDACISYAKQEQSEGLIDSFILGNPDDSIYTALYGATNIVEKNTLGIIETYSVPSIILASDMVVKTANVTLIEIRIAKGMCGKSYLTFTGDISDVTNSVEKVKLMLKESGWLLDYSVIPSPDSQLWKSIL